MDIKKLIAVAVGEIPHINNGLCPDFQTGQDSRDAECPACKILTDAAAKHDEMVCRVRQVEALQHRIVELEAEVESSDEMKTLRFCEGEWATEREALMRRLRAAEAQQNSYRAVLEMAHRLDTLDIRAHKKADGLLLINGIGKSRFATIKERVLYRLFGTLPREV